MQRVTQWGGEGYSAGDSLGIARPDGGELPYARGTSRHVIVFVVLLYRVFESIRAKLRDWAERPVRAGYYSWAVLSLIDSKTL